MKKSTHSAPFLLLLVLTACSGAPGPTTPARPGGVPQPGASAPAEARFQRALDAALARGSWEDLRLDAECQNENRRFRSTQLFGTGVGIWNHERQLTVPRERLRGLLEAVRRSGFAAMPESFGEDEEGDWRLEMICRVRAALDGVDKQTFQLSEGSQSRELKQLAEEILAVGAELGPSGVGAASLEDGLAKMARGELAPEALTLQLLRQAEDPKSLEGGWILRIENGLAQVSLPAPETGWTVARQVRLSRQDATDLARRLAQTHPEDLPVNLYATWYEDLEIQVLNQKKSLQARRFANLTPETHGEKQERFDQLVAALEELKRTLTP